MISSQFSNMQYLMARRSSSKYYGLTKQTGNEANNTSTKGQERINSVSKIIEESKTSRLSAKQIETLKSAAKDGLLGSSAKTLGPWGKYNLQKILSNTKHNSTLNAYRHSI
ncbi:hypothetical protein MHI22_03100 [Lysinibacillus sp. FSL L8-0312]|jgi:hypothetical protein|uniref:hypothetical protein n=1 Tax=Lysinibacillus sp. FSL L8-0312 TaxID=2921521 RepID=UPI0030FB3AA7